MTPALHIGTPLAQGLRRLLQRLEQRLQLRQPVDVFLAGGMAAHVYTADRVTTDVDAEFAARIFLPPDLEVEVVLEDGSREVVYLDTNYSPTLSLMHEDYREDAIPLDLGLEHLRVRALSPVDLAVSKMSRFADPDRADIEALARLGLISADAVERRALEAIGGYIGGEAMLRINIGEAVALVRQVEAEREASGRPG